MTRESGRVRIGLVLLILGALLVVFGAYVRAPRTTPPRRPVTRVWGVEASRPGTDGGRATAGAETAAGGAPRRFDPLAIALRLRAFVRGPLGVSGTIVDDEGFAVSGAAVRIAPDEGTGEFDLTAVTEARTDGSGRFAATVPGDYRIVALHAEADDPALGSATRRQIGAPKWGALDIGTIVLARAEEIAGVVVDEGGAPVAGASVRLRAVTLEREEIGRTESDERGAFRFAGRFPFDAELVVESSWYAGAACRVEPPESSLEIVLSRGRVLRGVVRSPSGAGISGASVSVAANGLFRDREAPPRRVETDAGGGFEAAGVLTCRLSLSASAEGFVSAWTEVEPDSADAWAEMELEPAPVVRGVVFDGATGRPLAGAVVDGDPEPTGDDGRFEARAHRTHGWADSVSYTIGARKEGYVPCFSTVSSLDLGRELRIDLARGARLEGLVLDDEGTPLVAAQVMLSHVGTWKHAWTNPSGRFEMDGLHPAPALVAVRAASFPFSEREAPVYLEAGKTTRVTIVVGYGRSVFGRVVEALSGEPIAKADVALWRHDDDKWFSDATARTDARGRFRIRGIGEGDTRLVVRARGRIAVAREVVLPPDGEGPCEVEIALERGLSLEGRVVHEDGTPVGAGSVSVRLEGRDEPLSLVASRLQPDGSFAFGELPRGSATVSASTWGEPERVFYVGDLEILVPSGPIEVVVRKRAPR